MKRSVGLWLWVGFAVAAFGGTILHFLYDWLGESVWIAPFSGVNESTWEHMKLLFWPMLFYAVIARVFLRDRTDFWCIQLRGILLGIGLIPLLFYTYNGVIGHSPDWINIGIFFLSAAVAYLYKARLFRNHSMICTRPKRSILMLCALALLFVFFTFRPPEIGLFRDPTTGIYGIQR